MTSRLTATVLCLTLTFLLMPLGVSAAEKELKRKQSFPMSSGHHITVDAATLTVSVRSADVVEAQVTSDLRISGVGEETGDDWLSRHTPVVTKQRDGIIVRAAPGKTGFLGFGHFTAWAHIRILTPSHSVPNITTTSGGIQVKGDFPQARPLHLRSATGDLEFTGATSELDIRTASGESRIATMRPLDNLFVRTSSGGVNLVGGARTAFVDTASGNVWLENLSGPTKVITSTGKISLRWDRLDAEAVVKVNTSSGKVHLVLPDGVKPQGYLTTTAGVIRSELPGVVNEAGDTVNLTGDGPVLEVESATGEIVLESDAHRTKESE